jgi:uncharacterized SAM-binding protein YcdF (DUF218 family)
MKARLDGALTRSARFYIPLSAGTPHLPPPLDGNGYPIFEAIPAAKYLHERGVPRECILPEVCSYDTIGNAFFTRTVHTGPRGLRCLLVVNSAFHMPRTEAIFRWVFGAAPDEEYVLSFLSTRDEGLSEGALAARAERERSSLEKVRTLAARITSLNDLHGWLYTEHGAYAWDLRQTAYSPVRGPLAESYGGA